MADTAVLQRGGGGFTILAAVWRTRHAVSLRGAPHLLFSNLLFFHKFSCALPTPNIPISADLPSASPPCLKNARPSAHTGSRGCDPLRGVGQRPTKKNYKNGGKKNYKNGGKKRLQKRGYKRKVKDVRGRPRRGVRRGGRRRRRERRFGGYKRRRGSRRYRFVGVGG